MTPVEMLQATKARLNLPGRFTNTEPRNLATQDCWNTAVERVAVPPFGPHVEAAEHALRSAMGLRPGESIADWLTGKSLDELNVAIDAAVVLAGAVT